MLTVDTSNNLTEVLGRNPIDGRLSLLNPSVDYNGRLILGRNPIDGTLILGRNPMEGHKGCNVVILVSNGVGTVSITPWSNPLE